MKKLFRTAAFSVLSSTPVHYVLRRQVMRSSPITILCYHTLGADHEAFDAWTVLRVGDFKQHIQLLRRCYDIVSLDQALAGPRVSARPQAVLTFDDGDIGLHTHLLPILRREELPVTLYIATAQIKSGKPYWFDRLINALQNSSGFEIDMRQEGLRKYSAPKKTGARSNPVRWQAISEILEDLKAISPARREELCVNILHQAGSPNSEVTLLQPLNRIQLKELAANPNVTIGAHSDCHNLLDQIQIEEAETSITQSRRLLREWTGQEIKHFAYPNGNHNTAVRSIVAKAGFASATVLDNCLSARNAEPYSLSRLAIGRYDHSDRLKLRLIGW